MTTADWHPDLTKRSEVASAGCGALASIQQEDLGQAEQEEHGTQHHHALFELHVHTDRPQPPSSPNVMCVPHSDSLSPLMHGPCSSPSPALPPVLSDKTLLKDGTFVAFLLELQSMQTCGHLERKKQTLREGLEGRGGSERER